MFKSVKELMIRNMDMFPKTIFCKYEKDNIDYVITYEQLNKDVCRFISMLNSMDIGDEHVAIWSKSNYDCMVAGLATLMTGNMLVSINGGISLSDAHELMLQADVGLVIYEDVLENQFSNSEIDMNGIKRVKLDNYKSFEGIDIHEVKEVEAKDSKLLLFTSGTTGKSKGVVINVDGLLVQTGGTRKIFGSVPFTFVSILPNHHVYYYIQLIFSVITGSTICLNNDLSKLLDDLQKYQPTMFFTVPTILQHIYDVARFKSANGESVSECISKLTGGKVKYFLTSSASVNSAIFEEFENAGIVVSEAYGLTETCGGVVINELDDIRHGSVGKLGDIYDVKIEDGEIMVRHKDIFIEYYKDEELTKEVIRDGWFATGDLGYIEDNFLYFTGRKKNLIILSNGENVSPEELEKEFLGKDEVTEVVVKDDSDAICAEIYSKLYGTIDDEILVQRIKDCIDKINENLPIHKKIAKCKIRKIPFVRNQLSKILRTHKDEESVYIDSKTKYVEPHNDIEKKICDIFAQILEIEQVGIIDNFFELGGHSLRATRMINMIEQEFGFKLSVKDIFVSQTPEKLAQIIMKNEKSSDDYNGIPVIEDKEFYPMSSTQKRLFLLWTIDKASISYNIPITIEFPDTLNPDKVKNTIATIINKNEVLRTRFLDCEGELVQKIIDIEDYNMDYVFIDDAASDDKALVKGFVRPFDLENGQLIRTCLVKRETGYLLMLDIHHIVFDGMSAVIFLREFADIYNDEGTCPNIRQYKDYSDWILNRNLDKQKQFWVDLYKDDVPVLDLPLDYRRPQEQSFNGSHIYKTIGTDLAEKVKRFANKSNSSEYMVLLSCAMILISKYSCQDDIVIGTPVSARTHRDTEYMLGMFVNTLAMRGNPSADKSYAQFLEEIKEFSLKAFDNQEYPFEELVDAIDIKRDISRNPLFDIMFVLQNNERTPIYVDGKSIDPIEQDIVGSKFDFTFNITDINKDYHIKIEYCTDLFKQTTIENMLEHYVEIIKQVVSQPEIIIRDIEIITEEEKKLILFDFNNTECEYPKDKTIVDLFEEQVEKYSDRNALEYNGLIYTYKEFNERVNCVAHKLRELGVGREDFVAIISSRNSQTMIAIMGILKAGAAYVPIDPNNPDDRIQYIVSDCKPRVLLYSDDKPEFINDTLVLDINDIKIDSDKFSNPEHVNEPGDMAYVIYTSGTTGKPKGVIIEHRSVSNYTEYNIRCHEVTFEDRILQFASFSFDTSVMEMCMSLLNGACLMMVTEEAKKDVNSFNKYIQNNITTTILPPQYYEISDVVGLRCVITGGSESNYNIVKTAVENNEIYVNAYGPTEITVSATYWKCDKNDEIPYRIPIGKPITNKKVYIIKDGKLCGVGVPGEICIGGEGLARGYLNNQELTDEKFVDNPYAEGRMYLSGDLGRWLPDGNIEYMGRIDNQVKISGYRIELGEIEALIKKEKGIKDCAVILNKSNSEDGMLVAYVTSDSEVDAQNIKYNLEKALPRYMVPAHVIQLEEIPVNNSGKIDVKKLLSIEIADEKIYVQPANETEAIVCDAFKEILGIKKVSVTDSFFELGGHSLRAMKLVNLIEETTGVKVPYKEIFRGATPKYLAEFIDKNKDNDADYITIPKAIEKQYYPMSSAQKRMYLLWQMDKDSIAYNMPFIISLGYDITDDKIVEILTTIVKRHEILRTSFVSINGEPMQNILEVEAVEIDFVVCNGEINELEKTFIRPFDLEKAQLMRVVYVKNQNKLLIDMHHIVSDGISVSILINEFITLYKGKQPVVLTHQYKDYSEWVNTLDFTSQKEYWMNVFNDAIPVLDLPLDYSRPLEKSYNGDKVFCDISEELRDKIRNLASMHNATEYMILLSAYMVMLTKYSRQDDVVVGNVLGSRTHKDTENMLGMFVNTLAMRGKPDVGKTFLQFIEEIKDFTLKAFDNQEYPFEELVDALGVKRDISRNPLFDAMFVYQNDGVVSFDDNVQIESLEYSVAKFDLTLNVWESNTGYYMGFEYCTALFKHETVEKMLEHYVEILNQIVSNPSILIGDIQVITEEEKQVILSDFNNTECEYPKDKTIVDLFEEQVLNHSDKKAIEYDGEFLTYKEVNEKANSIAGRIKNQGVGKGDVVAIMAVRNPLTICGILGILKSGAAYVPIDPNNPSDRTLYILNDCSPKILLHQGEDVEGAEGILKIDINAIDCCKDVYENPESEIDSEDLAYIIYTSGTTGKPKGVLIEHIGVLNLYEYFRRVHNITCDDRCLQFASLAFDASISEMCISILSGACMMMVKEDIKEDINSFKHYIEDGVTVAILPPQYYALSEVKGLKSIITAGSESSTDIVEKAIKENKKYSNDYGPTEVTVCATHWEKEDNTKLGSRVPIGKPIFNKQVYIMDGNNLCGIGVPGELCVSGVGIARGYLNLPELTAERFVSNPYGTKKLYRTGDLARWLPDGNIEFLGRIDTQVKIRGYRVEIGEIDSTIRMYEGIKDCAVIAKRDSGGDTEIYAYLVSEEELNTEDVKIYISSFLPSYMIPAYMVQIEKIPVTLNGKLDVAALNAIDVHKSKEFVAPMNETEIAICDIFSKILHIEKVGATDNFFDLGGHSLRASKLVNIIELTFNKKLKIKDIFLAPTPRQISGLLKQETTHEEKHISIPYAIDKEYYRMSAAQKRIYILWQMNKETTSYNTPTAFSIKGDVDVQKIKDALDEIVNRHEILRTKFLVKDGEYVQRVISKDETEIELTVIDGINDNNEIIQSFVKPFDLDTDCLVRACLIKKQGEYVFIVDIHHIIADGMSAVIFFDEFSRLYNGEIISDLVRQYKDYSEWFNNIDLSSQKAYWLNQFEGDIPVLDLHLDYSRPKVKRFEGKEVYQAVSKELSQKIRELTKKHAVTDYMFFLSALMVLLEKYSRQDDIVVGCPVSTRNHSDMEHMLGMFVNTIAMRGMPQGEKKFAQFLEEIKEICFKSYENQDYPFEELVDSLEVSHDISRNPLFDVMLVMQNNDEIKLNLNNTDSEFILLDKNTAKFDLLFNIIEKEQQFYIGLEYCTELFKKDSMERMLDNFIAILDNVISDDQIQISNIEMITSSEKQQVLSVFNNVNYVVDCDTKTVVDMFYEQAALRQDNTALVYYDRKVSYLELNQKSNIIARKLREKGVGTGDFVAIVSERTPEMIIAIIAILKAGAAYVPIDNEFPEQRVNYILSDCNPKAIVTYKANVNTDIYNINLDDSDIWEGNSEDLQVINTINDYMYVIYTSGTTGNPKGVLVKHYTIANLLEEQAGRMDKDLFDKVLFATSISFDVATQEIFTTLLCGGTGYLISTDDKRNSRFTGQYIINNNISAVFTTPSYFDTLVSDNKNADGLIDTLRCVVLAGEQFYLSNSFVNNKAAADILVCNHYGPSETHVVTINQAYVKDTDTLNIGKPIQNINILILNDDSLCGIGVPGELCISGKYIVDKYLNNKELSQSKFVKTPYTDEIIYRTGDLAIWLPDGTIEYLGRIDDQVKIRGYRIELSEIDNVLRKETSIKDCAVVVREDQKGDKAICAYLVSDTVLDIKLIKENIGKHLAMYMIPQYMMQIDAIPLTRNGKVDKKALPEIVGEINEYIEPTNETEKLLCKMFGEILGINRISITDNFFELGGHSLRATKLVNWIEEVFGIKVLLKDIFVCATPEKLAQIIDAETKSGLEYESIPVAEEKEYYNMSSVQKRTYLLWNMDKSLVAYNMPIALRLTGDVNPQGIRTTLEELKKRHEILRTKFYTIDSQFVQQIVEAEASALDYVEYEDYEKEDNDIVNEFIKPFDLENAQLIRAGLIKRQYGYLLIIDMHHIVSDGMSTGIFIKEFSAIYNSEHIGEIRQYKDYSEWINQKDLTKQKEYWVNQFDEIPVLEMPLDYPRGTEQSFNGGAIYRNINSELAAGIKTIAQNNGATEYMVMLSAAMIVLGKYSRQEDIVIGSPISGRTHKDTESMLGMFINTLAMRAKPENSKQYKVFLNEVKEICLKAYENQEYPFEELVEAVNVRRDFARNPLFDVMFVLQNNEHEDIHLKDVNAQMVMMDHNISKVDFTFFAYEIAGEYQMALEYCSDLFEEESANKILEHYEEVLKQITSVPDIKIGEIGTATESEKNLILNDFNNTDDVYDISKTVVDLFEEQVANAPEKTAIVYGAEKLTYRELNQKANILANILRENGIMPNDYVAISSERSIEMIIGIYGIIKAGGAYVPIDPSYPEERIAYMLDDAAPKAIVTYNAEIKTDIPIIDLANSEVCLSAAQNQEYICNPTHVNKPEDLVYCIYTSGTTGNPKGVMIEHRNLVNFISLNEANFFQASMKKMCDFVYSSNKIIFDITMQEIFLPLCNGIGIILANDEFLQFTKEDVNAIKNNKNIGIITTPTKIKSCIISEHNDILKYIDFYMIGAEKLQLDLIHSLRQINPKAVIFNGYGPTEATCGMAYYLCESDINKIPIGKPIANTKVYIMNKNELCGIGVPGELCVAGAQIARGYLNNSELTAEKFVKNPFGEGKMYHTGDLARWLADGNIEYLGRIDDQVKIRGFRIELGEIECRIRELDNVKDCVVIDRIDSSGENAIYAYIVSDEEIDISEIRNNISEKLPYYMIPAYMMQIDSIPTTKNGKLDKQALPEIEVGNLNEYVAPQNEKEQIVVNAFSDILKVEKIGINDNFYELGGDSIKAIQVVSKIRNSGYKIAVKDIMGLKTVYLIANKIEKFINEYSQDAVVGEVRHTPVMKWLKNINLKKPEHFNQAAMLCTEKFDIEVLHKTLTEVIKHHDMLRAVYNNNGMYIKSAEETNLYDYSEYVIETRDIDETKNRIEEIGSSIQAKIDISNGPLIKVALFKCNNEEHLLLAIHHLVIDGISWRVLIEDFMNVYNQILQGKDIALPLKTASFADWSELLYEYADSEELNEQVDYWNEIEQNIALGNIKAQKNDSYKQSHKMIMLSKEKTQELVYGSMKAYGTEINDLLLSALAISVKNLTNQEKISVNMEGHGREKLHKDIDIDRTVGWFTSMYPVIIDTHDDIKNTIISTKETLRKIPNHGIGYGVLKYLKDMYSEQEISMGFNYLGDMEKTQEEINILRISDYSPGAILDEGNELPPPIAFNGSIRNEMLMFDVSYDEGRYTEEFINNLVIGYENALNNIIAHCNGIDEQVKTASDFGLDDWDNDEFESLVDMINMLD